MTLTKSEAETGIIPIIYKYLGCVVDEHLELKEMVEEKAAVGGGH